MMYREDFWLARLGAAELPADEPVEELALAVRTILIRKKQESAKEEQNRTKRFCNFWGVSQDWLDFWEELYRSLVECGQEKDLLDFLEQPHKQFRYEVDEADIVALSTQVS